MHAVKHQGPHPCVRAHLGHLFNGSGYYNGAQAAMAVLCSAMMGMTAGVTHGRHGAAAAPLLSAHG
jgi:hypothetical protein